MKITHVAIYVKDLELSRDYYVSFFGGVSNNIYKNSKGFSSYFINFGNGALLELMHHVDLKEKPIIDKVMGYSHIAFSVGSRQAVLDLTEKIVNSGHDLYSPPRETGDGYFESCVADPDGNRVEITE